MLLMFLFQTSDYSHLFGQLHSSSVELIPAHTSKRNSSRRFSTISSSAAPSEGERPHAPPRGRRSRCPSQRQNVKCLGCYMCNGNGSESHRPGLSSSSAWGGSSASSPWRTMGKLPPTCPWRCRPFRHCLAEGRWHAPRGYFMCLLSSSNKQNTSTWRTAALSPGLPLSPLRTRSGWDRAQGE